jgi:DNA polymerase-3 subunit alpha
MRKALVEMHADRFEDIIALVALYRPGPMANIPTYCAVKAGEQDPDYIDPQLEPILKETFGVIIYQEQVMQIAQLLSGYSLGEADLLRRAMGKKIKSEMDAQRDRFVSGAMARGLNKARADEIFDLLAKFADYGFNKSHAAAYALIAYQTAWFKANYAVEFLAASMTLDKSNTDKLAEFANEARRLGITVEPPSVARSGVDFGVEIDTATQASSIVYALSAIKGVGDGQAAALVVARGATRIADIGDLAGRINPRDFNKRMLESLVAAGAFDAFEEDRARVFAGIESMLALAHRRQDERLGGQTALFDGEKLDPLANVKVASWPLAERLRREFDAVGFFLSGHPLDAYQTILGRLRVQRWADFVRAVKQGASAGRLAATVLDRQERRTRAGTKMGIVQLSDQTGQFEAILFQEGLNQYRDLLEKGAAVLVSLQASLEGEDVRVRIVAVESLDEAASRIQKGLRVFLRNDDPLGSLAKHLGVKGDGEVSLILMTDAGEVEMRLPGKYKVGPQIAAALKAIPGIVSVEHV